MKFGFLMKVCPETELFAKAQEMDPNLFGAKYHHTQLGDIIDEKTGRFIQQVYKLCYKGPVLSYLIIRHKLPKNMVVKEW